MTEILENLSKQIIEIDWLAHLVALVAGMLTSITPCSLSSIPLCRLCWRDRTGYPKSISAICNLRGWVSCDLHSVGRCCLTCWEFDRHFIIVVVYCSRCIDGINGFPDMGHIRNNPLKLSDFEEHEERLYRCFYRRYPWRCFFFPVFNTGTHCTSGHCCRQRQPFMGYSIITALFIRAWHSGGYRGHIHRLCEKLSGSEKYGKASTVLNIMMGGLMLLIGFYMFYLGF